MRIFKIFLTGLIALSTLCAVSCGDEESSSALNYEQPVLTMVRAIKNNDEQSYLNCFTACAGGEYRESENYNSALTEVLLPKSGKSASITYKADSSAELDKDEISELEAEYKEKYGRRLDISKAYTIEAKFVTAKNNSLLTDSREITVVNTDGDWKIYGSVIEEFNFS